MMDFAETVRQLSILYELSLSIGTSLDPYKMAKNFFKTLMSRKNLSYLALWTEGKYLSSLEEGVRPQNLPPVDELEENAFYLYYHFPRLKVHTTVLSSEVEWLEKAREKGFYIPELLESELPFHLEGLPFSIRSGCFFCLPALGVLQIFSPVERFFDRTEPRQLLPILEKFSLAFQGSYSYQRILEEGEKQKKAAIAEKELALERARQKEEFLANISHELRTPLNAIIGYIALVKEKSSHLLPSDQQANLKLAYASAKSLLQLINDILDFSKIESGKMEIWKEEVDVLEVLENCYLTAKGLLYHDKVELYFEMPSSLPTVWTDEIRLEQIINNFLSNAVKFTERGFIRLSAWEEKGSLHISIQDTGCGIPLEKQEKIFESFAQLDSSTKKRFGGTGLGLAITKRLCDLLGFSIHLSSQVGEGTTFTLKIPLEDQKEEASSLEASSSRGRGHQGLVIAPHLREVRAILPVFMGTEALQMLKQSLEDLPFEVGLCRSFEDLLRFVEGPVPIWSIVVDSHHLEVVERCRKNPLLRELPVLLHHNGRGPLISPVEVFTFRREGGRIAEDFLFCSSWKARNKKVLVVEDHAVVREELKLGLERAGCFVLEAEDGKKGLDIIRKRGEELDILILDLFLPELDGFRLLHLLRENYGHLQLPVVAITAKDLNAEERGLLKKGAELFISKSASDWNKRVLSASFSIYRKKFRRILIVDDNEANLYLLRQVFEQEGYSVFTALSAKEAIEIARGNFLEVVLMDLAMPDMDGFEATQVLGSDPETSHICVIACSAFVLKEYQQRAFQAGCSGYITKPIMPDKIVNLVQKMLIIYKIWRLSDGQNSCD
ncbi:MAG: response regulator [Planctomycetota bacterium]|nr:MAG: response regulator [Planctomycetota bacterium]